ncbi:uncharacterized protein LOC126789053 [Argentina anserina]|uniref:uncharacterized protein LOC126789053 n=1 Tax=Argentina anserina TaxID=57926 RepID=UPI0021764DD1|nr:uncharacterized protein LOC126789053 [Potentilla anserina]
MAWLVSLRILLISSGVVALALAMKLYVPLVFEFAMSNLPLMWNSCKSLLRPPYLYVVINAIIITIAASSMFHHDRPQAKLPSPESESTPPSIVYQHREDHDVAPPVVYKHIQEDVAPLVVSYEHREEDMAAPPVVYDHTEAAVVKEVTSVVLVNNLEEPVAQVDLDLEDEGVSKATWTMPKNATKFDDIVLSAEKPLVSTRFSHRKPARFTPEGGRPLRVSKAPKRHDTLENTWKTITEGRPIPLSRHMRKSDPFDHPGRGGGFNVDVEVDDETSAAVHKSKTFKDLTNQQKVMTLAAVSSSSPAGIKLRKEPSLSQDELNRRVEAFIHKFNEDMRLQRQESLNQFMEMINRGSH